MSNWKAIIVDDEKHCRLSLKKMLEWYCPQVSVVSESKNADEGIKAIKEHTPDIVFLDIEMPRKNGFDLINEFDKVDFNIIFTTAYDEFALQAFKVNAAAYLLKPVSEKELTRTVNKIIEQPSSTFDQNKLMEIYEMLKLNNSIEKIAIPTLEGMEFVNPKDIIRCKAEGNYTKIHLISNESIFISKTLKQIAELINKSYFIRPHASHLVNVHFIKKYLKGVGGQLVLEDGTIIPVSRHRKSDLNL